MADSITVKAIYLQDENGKNRGSLSAHKDGVQLTMNRVVDGQASWALDVGVSDERGPMVVLHGSDKGEIRLEFDGNGNHGSITGHFTRFIAEGIQGSGGTPAFGAWNVQLVE